MKYFLLFVFSFTLYQIVLAQEYLNVSGFVVDSKTSLSLSFSNIRVAESTLGTASNKEGQFNLKLKRGNYKLIASYIGYISDTIAIELLRDISNIKFMLTETKLNLPEIVITPGINPALEIIRQAILKKKERERKNFKL
ncbi:MAG: carboxypeptidase-like regulatory domain-containing protein [Ignavibacteriales bacterium]|nr:carboxypeptidase-like regulatory domain-containing protein [Ignavibacteriales bacterium]